jgi:2-polyprenyl-3-methyl-5-hydroxy-6-metoxy-1,4-benzoquinol methylase
MNGIKCKICSNESGNEIIIAEERLFGLGDKFEYILCSNCKCIQIRDIPADMNRYYPQDYYAFEEPRFPSKLNRFNFCLKRSLINHYMGNPDITGFLLSFIYPHPFPWIRKREIGFDSRILDIGTGTGRKLLSLQRSGFRDLTGIDPYITEDRIYKNGLRVLKKEISETDGKYDFITMHHSFEHMPDPANVINHLSRLLDQKGVAVIRIPVADCFAWHKYREFWVGLDAPRHFFLHTPKSMEILVKGTDLFIDEIVFDSGAHQFIMSDKYARGLTLFAPDDFFSKKDIRKLEKEAKILNMKKQGDTACFYLKKIKEQNKQ